MYHIFCHLGFDDYTFIMSTIKPLSVNKWISETEIVSKTVVLCRVKLSTDQVDEAISHGSKEIHTRELKHRRF